MEFSVADYIVFSLSLIASSLIGFYYACSGDKQRSVGEFLFGDKKLSAFPIAMSLLASFTSATGILGATSEVYSYGIYPIVECIAATIAILITTYFYIPLIYNLHIPSIYMYLELRFNKWLRRFVSCLFLLNMFLYMSLCLYGPAASLSQVTGLSLWASIVGSGLVCNLYTIIGGIKAVVWTDTLQQTLVFAGLLAVMIQGFISAGGVSNVWNIAVEGKRISHLSFSSDITLLYTFWSVILGHTVRILSGYTSNQSMVQRFLSVESIKVAQRATLFSIPLYVFNKTIYVVCGLVIYARYYTCDPKYANKIYKREQILPLFVMEILGVAQGMPGLFVAAIYSSSLSAMSSGLNSMAAVILNDIIKPVLEFYNKKNYKSIQLSNTLEAIICKVIVATFGLLTIGMAFLVPYLGNTLYQAAISVMGLASGSLLGIFTLGMFIPFANSYGATIAGASGTFITIWMFIGSIFYGKAIPPSRTIRTDGCLLSNETLIQLNNFSLPNISTTAVLNSSRSEGFISFYRVSPLYYSVLGFVITVIFGSLISLITGGLQQQFKRSDLVHRYCFNLCMRHSISDPSRNLSKTENAVNEEIEKLNSETQL